MNLCEVKLDLTKDVGFWSKPSACTNFQMWLYENILRALLCMQTFWRYCPVARQSKFQVTEDEPFILTEAAADYNP